MKTFQQFMEQIPTRSMHLDPERERTRRAMETQRRISSRQHRRHVHGELARTASYELSHMNQE